MLGKKEAVANFPRVVVAAVDVGPTPSPKSRAVSFAVVQREVVTEAMAMAGVAKVSHDAALLVDAVVAVAVVVSLEKLVSFSFLLHSTPQRDPLLPGLAIVRSDYSSNRPQQLELP